MPPCTNCHSQFTITQQDLQFLHKLSPTINGQTFNLPEPTECPNCRQQRRLATTNQIHLFKRPCDATGETIISNFPPDSPHKIYKQDYWFSDAYDGTEHGREFDFSRPFFHQYHELSLATPRFALFTEHTRDINSAYTNSAGLNKNCYFIFDSDENQDCYYSYGLNKSQNCCDITRCQNLELCYEAIDCKNCYRSTFIQNSENCSDSHFLKNCIGCKNCIMCSNLNQKEYHVLNKPVSKEEFERIKSALKNQKYLQQAIKKHQTFTKQFPQRFIIGTQNENVSGNYLINCKNATECFDSQNLWDCTRCYQMIISAKDSMDCDECGDGELMYESSNVAYNLHSIRFVDHSMNQISEASYCSYSDNIQHCFGCIGLKRKKYCILNKQYSEDDYHQLVPKIIEHMRQTGEWGQFFPIQISPFPYNLTQAQTFYPLSENEATAKSYKWQPNNPKSYLTATYSAPDTISEVANEITKEILACKQCQKSYTISAQELHFYRQLELPLPQNCFNCRHENRFKKRNSRHLHQKNCDRCHLPIITTHDNSRTEKIFCEKCYQEAIN